MADIEDVIEALIAQVRLAIYPDGAGTASTASCEVVAYQGWPNPDQLDADLAALETGGGRVHVTIFPEPGDEPAVSYIDGWRDQAPAAASLTLSLGRGLLTVGGAPGGAQLLGFRLNGALVSHQAAAGEGPRTAAQALLALTPGASLLGGQVVLPLNASADLPRVAALGASLRELRRNRRRFGLHLYADSPARRREIGDRIEAALAEQTFLALPDGAFARLAPQGVELSDASGSARVWRRDLFYWVDYATTQISALTPVFEAQISVSQSGPTGEALLARSRLDQPG
jgi:hypothetical protein